MQQPEYPDPEALQRALDELAALPPLVTSWEIVALKELFAQADTACYMAKESGRNRVHFYTGSNDAAARRLCRALRQRPVGGTTDGGTAGQHRQPQQG